MTSGKIRLVQIGHTSIRVQQTSPFRVSGRGQNFVPKKVPELVITVSAVMDMTNVRVPVDPQECRAAMLGPSYRKVRVLRQVRVASRRASARSS